jgi:hypothetical protein
VLFAPLVDGTAERVRSACTVPFGRGRPDPPDAGWPVPSRLLAGELARTGAAFTFLRRSFTADVAGRDLQVEVPRILADCAAARQRTPGQVLADRAELLSAVGPLDRVAQPA